MHLLSHILSHWAHAALDPPCKISRGRMGSSSLNPSTYIPPLKLHRERLQSNFSGQRVMQDDASWVYIHLIP